MKLFIRILKFSLIMLVLSSAKAQDLNINQTLEYLNKKINDNRATMDNNIEYKWEINDDGQLTISQYVNGDLYLSQTAYLKSLDKNRIVINDANFDQEEYFYTIQIKCKNNLLNVLKKGIRSQKVSSIFIRIAPNEITVNQIKNALTTLIYQAESTQEFKVCDVDPFDIQEYLLINN